jgi:hypothetical protein
MANETKIIITADGSKVVIATDEVASAFKTLKGKTIAQLDEAKAGAIKAYESIKNSGIASAQEIEHAERLKNMRLADLNKEMEAGHQSFTSRLKAHWLAYSAAVAGAMITINKAWDLMKLAANVEQINTSYEEVTNSMKINGQVLLENLKRVTAGTIDESALMQKAVKGLAQELTGDQLIRIGEMARLAARKQGEDVQVMFDQITDAIANQQGRTLKQLGLLSKEGMRLVEQATAVGITSINTYALASAYATMQQAKFNLESTNTAERMQQASAALNELKEGFAGVLSKVVFLAMYGFSELDRLLLKIPADSEAAMNAIADVFKQVPVVGKYAGNLKGNFWQTQLQQQADESQKYWNLVFGGGDATEVDLADKVREGRYQRAKADYEKMIADLKAQIEAMKKGGDTALKMADDIKKLNEQIQSLIDKDTLSPLAQIEKQADAWREAGQDRVLIGHWVTSELSKLEMADQERLEAKSRKEIELAERTALAIREIEKREASDWNAWMDEEERKIEETWRRRNALMSQEMEMWKQQYGEISRMLDAVNQIGGQFGQGLGQYMSGALGNLDILTGQDPFTQRMDQVREMYMQHLVELGKIKEQELFLWRQKEREKQQIELEGLLKRFDMEKEVDNLRLQNTYTVEAQRMSITLNALSQIQGALSYFASFSDKQNKVMFLLSKAVGIAIIWVQTQIAAMSAAAAVAGIPIVGPALAAAAYAQMQTLGAISMAAAAAAAIGQMATMGKGAGSFSVGKYSQPSTSTIEQPKKEKPKETVINFYVYGDTVDLDQFSRKLLPYINKASEDRVR